ncbi:toll-like receptor 13 [Centruroides sculpturatus]|uniref:toll-like receptor 13 n=1 Tax=Centruroides sculpturatus TaxID=218467 RepID=UPI000C6D99BB|nr:toll-like receptor 13 [Centruroides sculpturatus]
MDFVKYFIIIFIYIRTSNAEMMGFCEYKSDSLLACTRVSIDYAVKTATSNITYIQIQSTPQKVLSIPFKEYIPAIETVDISGELEIIRNNTFSGLSSLRVVLLVKNRLSHLEEGTFCNLDNLKIIRLVNNKFTTLSDLIPAIKCLDLNKLHLSENALLQSITSNEVEQIQDIRVNELDLTNCAIRRIDDNALTGLNNVRKLLLTGNPLDYEGLRNVSYGLSKTSVRSLIARRLSNNTFIKSDVLMPLSNGALEVLDIGENRLVVFPYLLDFKTLRELVLFRCELIELNGYEIFGISNLQTLDLSDNKLRRIIFNESDYGYRIHNLDLSYNGLKFKWDFTLPNAIFTILPDLERLDLTNTLLPPTLTDLIFTGNNSLKIAKLAGCSIKNIQNYAFKDLNYLTDLTLNYNKINNLRSEMFYGLSNLVVLYLGYNLIDNFNSSDIFIHLVSLEILDLSWNNIVQLEPVFKPLKSLEVLILDNNRIIHWNDSILTNNTNITYFRVSGNDIVYITPAMLQDFSTVKNLDFSKNKFDCMDCNITILQNWQRSTSVILESKLEDYTCITPSGQKERIFEFENSHCYPKEKGINILLISGMSSCVLLIIFVILISVKFKWHIRYYRCILMSRVKRYRESNDSNSYMYDAFVSYDSLNSEWIINQLLPTLETEKTQIKFCLHDRDCLAGNDVTEEVFEYVQKCRKIILIISDSYIKNRWCMFELQMAQHRLFEERRDSLILIFLGSIQELQLPSNLKYLMSTRTYIPWTDHPMGQKLFWKRLIKALNKPDTLKLNRIV